MMMKSFHQLLQTEHQREREREEKLSKGEILKRGKVLNKETLFEL